MRIRFWAMGLLAASLNLTLSPAWAAGKCERLVVTGDTGQAPYLWQDPIKRQRLIGAHADLLTRIGKELGVAIELIDAGTAVEAQEAVVAGRVDLLLGVPLSMEALDTLDFVHPALPSDATVVWTRRQNGLIYTGWNDLPGRTGWAPPQQSLGPQFDAFARSHMQPDHAGSALEAFRKLQQGQVDYLLYGRSAGAAQVALLAADAQLQSFETGLNPAPRYLALSHNSACNEPWLRGQLAKKMTELTASDLPEAQLQQSLQRWTTQHQSAPTAVANP
jgi:polar amino acid transport system substrate-binding protein